MKDGLKDLIEILWAYSPHKLNYLIGAGALIGSISRWEPCGPVLTDPHACKKIIGGTNVGGHGLFGKVTSACYDCLNYEVDNLIGRLTC